MLMEQIFLEVVEAGVYLMAVKGMGKQLHYQEVVEAEAHLVLEVLAKQIQSVVTEDLQEAV